MFCDDNPMSVQKSKKVWQSYCQALGSRMIHLELAKGMALVWEAYSSLSRGSMLTQCFCQDHCMNECMEL